MEKSDLQLTAAEREYICTGEEPYSYDKWMIRLTEDRKKELDELYESISDEMLWMDSHGINTYVCIFKRKDDETLLAFPWGTSSEETFWGGYGDDTLNKVFPVFKVKAKVKTIIVYVNPDDSPIDSKNISTSVR